MEYYLMHNVTKVALISLDEDTGVIQRIDTLFEEFLLPCGVGVRNAHPDRAALNEWWIDRSIPASRSGIERALEEMNVSSTKMLLSRCFGLSLSDQYWICPKDSTLSWHEVNFFENDFSEDIGDILIGKRKDSNNLDFRSPDNTSDGALKKRWKIVNGKRCLLKSGSNPFRQQPFNEVIASKIAKRLNIPHVEYDVVWDGGEPYSICEDFIDKDTELVSAWRIMKIMKRDNATSLYRHYVNCCGKLGVDIVPALDRMIVLDYLIANEDRHLNNFGLVRNAYSMEWLGAAPIYDSGSSLGYDKTERMIDMETEIECKPFKKHHEEQLKLVSFFDWIDFDALFGIEHEITSVLSETDGLVSEARKEAIVQLVLRRIGRLKEFAGQHKPQEDRPEEDVTENLAKTYKE